jgi:hypothetical protein
MPTVAIILTIFYILGMIYDVARGTYTAHITPGLLVGKVVFNIALSALWLSLPVCGGIPTIVIIVVVFIAVSTAAMVAHMHDYLDVTPGGIAFSLLIQAAYIAILLTLGYC